ncbi:MAG: zinc dependent phospholipase C family protein [Candidatus Acidiferrales bacterium]
MNWRRVLAALAALGLCLLCQPAGAYSVFTHEELIDLAWSSSIRPLLLARFPGSTDAELREAHSFAYGGCAIQDMGYYPFAKQFFSNLTHYVRSGDFVSNLLNDATTRDEYAFAIGALSHYLGDSIGHSQAINLSTPVAFPNLEREFGPRVTYDEDPDAHIRTEWAFDINQLSKLTFAPPSYLKHVGFRVPRRLLDRAFRETYGFEFPELVGKTRPAVRSYRTSVRTFIPAFAGAEVVLHRRQFPPDAQNDAYRIFAERLQRADYERHWEPGYKGPGFGSHVLAIVVKLVPKVGVLSLLAIKIPTPETEGFYVKSVNHTIDSFTEILDRLRSDPHAALALPNLDLDTGNPVKPGTYRLTDETYAQLLARLTSQDGRPIPAELQANILAFYADPDAPNHTKKNPKAWKRVQAELPILRSMKTTGE